MSENKHSLWTLLTDGDEYAKSAVKLLNSARVNSKIKFDAIIMELKNKPLKTELRGNLIKAGWKICVVERIAPKDEGGTFPRFRDQFTKFHIWAMIEYESAVYMDSDCFVIGNIDKLFQIHRQFNDSVHRFGVTRDIYAGTWRSTFNMGVFVLKPNLTEYERLTGLQRRGEVRFQTDQCEQGFLNEVYKNQWLEIGFEFNANLAVYSQQRAYWDEREKAISVVHYTMNKPWDCGNEYKAVCDLWRNYVVVN
jgi:glycogenin glucosyltransferase